MGAASKTLAGEVWQWCSDWHCPDYFKTADDPTPSLRKTDRVSISNAGANCSRIETDPGAFSRGRVHRSHRPPPAREHWQGILLAKPGSLGTQPGDGDAPCPAQIDGDERSLPPSVDGMSTSEMLEDLSNTSCLTATRIPSRSKLRFPQANLN